MKRLLICCVLLLAACGTIPEEGVPAPVTPIYEHPAGVFTMPLPPAWVLGDFSSDSNVLVTFAPPGGSLPLLTVYTVRLGGALDDTAFSAAMGSYLRAPANAGLDVVDRVQMADGSWRAAGVRHLQGQALPVNLFMQGDGPFFSVLEVVVQPDDALTSALLTMMVNGYTVNSAAEWPTGAVDAIPVRDDNLMLAAGNLSFGGVFTWTDATGQFHISGQLGNRVPYALEAVAVEAVLYDGLGTELVRSGSAVPLPVLLDEELTPFDVVFPDGRPPLVARYSLQAEGVQAAGELATYYSAGSFDWEDRAEYDDAGRLHVRGTIWNVGGGVAYEPQVVITLFDIADHVIGYVAGPLDSAQLAAGESTRFDVPLPQVGGEPVRYQLTLFARNRPQGG